MTVYTQTVNVGSSFEQTYIYLSNDSPVDLSSWSAVLRFRDEKDSVISTVRSGDSGDRTLTITPLSGQIDVTMSSSATSGIAARTGTFELEIYETANPGRVFRIVDGAVRYRPRGRAMLDNTVCVIKKTSNRVTVETQQVSSYQRIDRGPPGTRGAEGPTVLANASRIGAVPSLDLAGGTPVALDNQTQHVNCRHRLSIKSFSSIQSMLAKGISLGSCMCELEPGVIYSSDSSLDFYLGEGVVLSGGSAHGNYSYGAIQLTQSSASAAIKFGKSLNCGIVGLRIEAPNLPYAQAMVSFESDGTSDVSGAFLDRVALVGNNSNVLITTSSTSVNVDTVRTAAGQGPTTVTLTVGAGLDIATWQKITVVSRGSSASFFGGAVSYSGTTLVVRPAPGTNITGTGAHTDWDVYVRRVPTGVRMGDRTGGGKGNIHCSLTDVTGVRLRAYVDCTGYSHEFTVLRHSIVEAELAGYFQPSGEGWTIIGGTCEPTADARGRLFDYSAADSRFCAGLTIVGGWCGDLNGVYDTGPWIRLWNPEDCNIIGGLYQGQTGAALKVRGGRDVNAFKGSKFSCGAFIEFEGPEQTIGFDVPNPLLAIGSMHVNMGSYAAQPGQLVGTDKRYFLGSLEVSGSHTAGFFVTNGSATLTMTGNLADYALGNAGALEVTTSANGQKLSSMVPTITGRMLFIMNTGTYTLVLPHEDAAGTAAYRWNHPSGADITLAVGQGGWVWYSNQISRWRIAVSP